MFEFEGSEWEEAAAAAAFRAAKRAAICANLEGGWTALGALLAGRGAGRSSADRGPSGGCSRVGLKLVSADELAINTGGNRASGPEDDDDDDRTVGVGVLAALGPPIGLNPEVEEEEMGAKPEAFLKPDGLKLLLCLFPSSGKLGPIPESADGPWFWPVERVAAGPGSFAQPAVEFLKPALTGFGRAGFTETDGRASRVIPAARAIRSSSLASLFRSFSSLASVERPIALRDSLASKARFA